MSDFYHHWSTYLTGLQKSKDKEIVCHTLHTHMAGIFLEGFMRLHFFVAWSDWKSFKDFRDIIVQPQKRFEGTEFMSDFYHHWSTYLTGLLFRVVLNQRANRIHACGLWQEVQFDMNSSEKKTIYEYEPPNASFVCFFVFLMVCFNASAKINAKTEPALMSLLR